MWTTKQPTQPGFYLCRHSNDRQHERVTDFYKTDDGDLLSCVDGDTWDIDDHLSCLDGVETEWLGPFTGQDVVAGMKANEQVEARL